jgi:1,4-dihydroxy-2-naphthoate polyprenyltransferase
MTQLKLLEAFIRLGRPHFLIGGVIFHLLGVVLAVYAGAKLNLAAVFWGQIAVTATQWMTQYANEYFDLDADWVNRTPTHWSGGSRILLNGRLSPHIARNMAYVLAVIALVAICVLILHIQPGILNLGLLLAAFLLAWFYSAPPFRLHSRGVGELTATVVVTLLTPLTGYYLQTGQIALMPLLAVLPLGCLQFAMLLAIELPDAVGDQQVGKRTLVVRYGSALAARWYNVTLIMTYALLPLLVWGGVPLIVILAIAALSPLAWFQIACMRRGDWQIAGRWNALARNTLVLLMGTAGCELAVFLWLILAM